MHPGRRHEIERLFEAALDELPAERAGWLRRRCADDAELLAEVGALLEAHERAEGIMERGVARVASVASRLAASPMRDRRIGPYRVLRELGRGGMGVVYLAERDDGTYRRRVAIKLLRDSPDAEELHERFLAERQILASLDHPNIAQLLDAGVTEGQLPFLVMEYVDGVPITDYCDRHRLDLAARLRLFGDVCAAVHHAHRNLVIHRDLKPGNILVTAAGQVKLLDFGIAKLLNPSLAPMRMPVTRTELRLLTPEYASPEQVRGGPLTTASDVYALGVVLYELLAGRRPYRVTTGSPAELTRLVLELEPERPSARVTRAEVEWLDADASRQITPDHVAAARGVSAERLQRQLRGDLDDITMMALRKEASRRYGSAEVLGQDVQRWMDGLPVLAHRDGRWYRARKLLGRHRVETAAVALVAVALVGGTGVAVWQARLARQESDHAEQARVEAEQARAQAEEVARFLTGLFEVNDPEVARGDLLTARDLLQRGEAHADRLASQPVVQARLLEVLGRVHRGMGDLPQSRTLLERSLAIGERAVGAEHPALAETLLLLSDVLRRQGHYPEAEAAARRALAIRQRALGPRHPDVADVYVRLSFLAPYRLDNAGAVAFAREALAIRRGALPPDDPRIPAALEQLGAVLKRQARTREAEAAYREALAIRTRIAGPSDSSLVGPLFRLGDLLVQDRDDSVAAEQLYRRGLAIMRASYGEGHLRVANAMGTLAYLLSHQGRHDEAEQLARGGFAIVRDIYGPEHDALGGPMYALAGTLSRAGKHDEAETLAREAVRRWERAVGPRHSGAIGARGYLADVLLERGRLAEAEATYRDVLARRRELLGDTDSPLLAIQTSRLAHVLMAQGRYAEADSLFRWAVATYLQHAPDSHFDVRHMYRGMAELYARWNRPADAARYRQLAMVH